MELLQPGATFKEFSFGGHALPDEFRTQRYGVKMHGVGLCEEFPAIYYPEDFIEGAFDYTVEPGMVFCVEVFVGEVGGHEGVQLEEQVLITETGFENLPRCPFAPKLMG